MPRVKFNQDYSHHLHPMQTVQYKAGATYLVSQAIAAAAVDECVGIIVPSPGEVADRSDHGDSGG